MLPETALSYSLHSWRHLYPTAARQLRMSKEAINDMGHWNPNSNVPLTYDSAGCVSELAHKSTIVQAVAKGWSLVPSGCISETCPSRKLKRAVWTLFLRRMKHFGQNNRKTC